MSPKTALEKQIEGYRRMTGEERVGLALELYELACGVAREGIRQQHPKATREEVEDLLLKRLQLARKP